MFYWFLFMMVKINEYAQKCTHVFTKKIMKEKASTSEMNLLKHKILH